jgi:hypothetical protein
MFASPSDFFSILYLFFLIIAVSTHFVFETAPGISLKPEGLRKAREEFLGCLLR